MRKALFWIHLTAGVVCGAVILIMSVTGVVLAFERQIVGWIDAKPASTGTPMALDVLLASAEAKLPAPATAITVFADPKQPVEIAAGREHVVYVDRVSGTLREGSRGVRRFFSAIESWHRWLGATGKHRETGKGIADACNAAFLLLVCSGPFLWFPATVGAFRRGLSGRARDFNWHNVIGIWSTLPLVVIVAGAVVMSYAPANPQQRQSGGQPERLSYVAAFFATAQQQVTGWRRITMRVPAAGSDSITITIDRGNGARPDLRGQLMLDRKTGRVVKWEPYAAQAAGRKLRGWARFSHTGEAFGITGQLIAMLATAGSIVLVWTGIALAIRRFARRQTGRAPSREPFTSRG